jgi:hypothetical protein
MAGPLWRADHAAGCLEKLLEQIVQDREALHVLAGLGRRDQLDMQLGKKMGAQGRAVGLGQGGDAQALADPAGERQVGLDDRGGPLAQVLGELKAADQVLTGGDRMASRWARRVWPAISSATRGSSSQ